MFFLLLVAVVSLTCVSFFTCPNGSLQFTSYTDMPLWSTLSLCYNLSWYISYIYIYHWACTVFTESFGCILYDIKGRGAPLTTEISPQAINASQVDMWWFVLNCRGGAMCNQESPAHEFLRKNPIMYRVHADGVPFPPARQLPRRTCSSSRKNMFKTDNSNGKKWRLYHGNEG